MQAKLHILFLTPVTLIFIFNSIILYVAESFVLLAVTGLIYVLVVTISLPFLGSFSDRLHKRLKELSEGMETVNYSAKLLSNQSVPQNDENFERVYSDLKQLLIACRDSGQLSMAKEIGRICVELGTASKEYSESNIHHMNIEKYSENVLVQLRGMGIETKKVTKQKEMESPFFAAKRLSFSQTR